jgi:peptidoglycan DL-endopeptidase CwlO
VRNITLGKRQAPVVLLILAAALFVAPGAFADPGSIASKQAEAQQVLGELQGLDSNLEQAIQSYDLARSQLASIDGDLHVNEVNLGVARTNLRRSQKALSQRLLAVYTAGPTNSTLEVLLGSTSLDDLLSRIDDSNTISRQDTSTVRDVIRFRGEIKQREARLQHARAEKAVVVQNLASTKASIEQQLGERRALLSSIRGQIVQMKAAEAARQAQLKRELQARLAAQQQAAATAALQPALPVATAESTAPTATPSAGAVASSLPAAPPSQYGGVVGIAMQYLGTPYVWGGASPGGFDCSGLVMYVYSQVGVSLPHSSYAQYGYGMPVSMGDLQPGDLVFFDGLGHVGIYVGGGQFIHAPHTGDVVKISSLTGWYAASFVGARRL